jgi:hypothetical protein
MPAKYRDPVTGDPLSLSELISWKIQAVIRRWTFLLIFTCATIVCWYWGRLNATVLLWWNLCASYLAIFIENTVGIAMFSQTRRDALIIREIRKYERMDAAAHKGELAEEMEHRRMLTEIIERLDRLEETEK